jgi:cysteine desulfurase
MAGISASSGSACATGDPKPAAVLEAIGLDPAWTTGGLRLTVGRQNTMEDVEYTIRAVQQAVASLKQFMRVAGLV